MKCDVCGNPGGPCEMNRGKPVSSFSIHLRSKCELYMTVPCFVRKQVNKGMGDTMRVGTEDEHVYRFKLEKRSHKTRINGDGYRQFLNDYGMQPYDRVKLTFCAWKEFVIMEPQDSDGFPKERVEEEYVFENSATAVVFTKGVDPKPSETTIMNHVALQRGLGLGAVFVHRLTETDVDHNGLRIPKNIVSVLDIPRSGTAILVQGDEDVSQEAKYFRSADGRLRFKSGWAEFAKENRLKKGMMVLIMFHLILDNIQISVDVVGN